MTAKELNDEANQIEELLKGKSVSRVLRPRESEVCIEFTDGSRFFIQSSSTNDLVFSIT